MELILSEKYQSLITEIELLRETIAKLLADKEYILTSKKTVLEAEYYSKIGIYQIKLLEVNIEMLRMKRKIELIQASLNQNKPVDINKMEEQLETELCDWKMEIEKLKHNLQYSQNVLSNLVEIKEEVSALYRKLTKQLHPDLNPNQTQEMKDIWNRVQTAYRNNDLQELKLIETIFRTLSTQEEVEKDSLEILNLRKQELSNITKQVLTSLTEIQKSFPFDMEKILNNPFEVSQIVIDIQTKIKTFQEQRDFYKTYLTKLLMDNFSILGIHPENI